MWKDYTDWQHRDWDRAHRENDVSALTGTSLGGHLGTLGAGDLLTPEVSLLCIGVGMGDWVREAAGLAAEVWALDVSEAAGVKVADVATFTTDLAVLPSDRFDLALSLWVAPHMSDHDLEVQLREVIRSLKPGGVFAIHYKEPLDNEAVVDNRAGASDEFRRAGSALMLRRRKHFADMVRWAGGHVIRNVAEMSSHFFQIVETSAHVGKGIQ